ncbi:MAG: hypothetical protein GWP59_06510 [Chlamydiales bacterium]|nr:SEC-C domain-containing protein [Chlamydiales bacterium]NCF71334.1 hypothetical protein [Chlamydiales bacterium]
MSEPKRNDPCSCGSGKKYKKCCMGKTFKRKVSVLSSKDVGSTFSKQIRDQVSSLSQRKIKPITQTHHKFVMTNKSFLNSGDRQTVDPSTVAEVEDVPDDKQDTKIEVPEEMPPFHMNQSGEGFKPTDLDYKAKKGE